MSICQLIEMDKICRWNSLSDILLLVWRIMMSALDVMSKNCLPHVEWLEVKLPLNLGIRWSTTMARQWSCYKLGGMMIVGGRDKQLIANLKSSKTTRTERPSMTMTKSSQLVFGSGYDFDKVEAVQPPLCKIRISFVKCDQGNGAYTYSSRASIKRNRTTSKLLFVIKEVSDIVALICIDFE